MTLPLFQSIVDIRQQSHVSRTIDGAREVTVLFGSKKSSLGTKHMGVWVGLTTELDDILVVNMPSWVGCFFVVRHNSYSSF